ncbi:hypothetical protein FF38_12529 [Lucilia cuprina]|uniref:Uncharacterized protein n=1 Tax=Lucilia cuprina TaxID=7375 RepID=A0A0L0BND3_LUCCU|nr:hypothetical protein FF38_12529 [Lucilia cuprina]
MFKFRCVSLLFVLLQIFDTNLAITTTENDDNSVQEFQYCLRKSSHPNLRECIGRTAISFLQRFDERDNFTFAGSLIAARDDKVASRSLVNFLDTDPVDFRGILENAGAVISQRALEFHMDAIYPGLMFKIGPSADSNSVAQFMLDPTVDERNFNYEEVSTARILTKQYLLPFLLGFKFNLVALVPILFTIICLLLKKSLFIAKLVVYISSILGVGGVAGALGTLGGGLGGLFGGGHGFGGGIPPHPPPPFRGQAFAGGNFGAVAGGGLYPGKNTVYSQYEQDELQHISPYKRQDRKVVFEKTRENTGRISSSSNVRSTVAPVLATPAPDRFYEYEKQVLMQDRSGKLRHSNGKLGPSAYTEDEEEVAGVINVSSNHHFKTSDNSGWKVLNLRVVAIISTQGDVFSARQMGQSMAQCFGQNEIINCLENKIFETLDRAIANNDTWQFSDFLVIEKNTHNTTSSSSLNEDKQNKLLNTSHRRSLSDTLALKMLQLAQTRSLKLQLPSSVNNLFIKRSISSALDDFNADTTDDVEDTGATEQLEQEEGTLRKLNGLVDDKISKIKKSGRKKPFKKLKPSYSSPLDFALTALPSPTYLIKNKNKHNKNKQKHKYKNKFKNKYKNKHKKNKNKIYYSLFNIKPPKGRKKKDKDKNMAMMGGMAMLAMVAQMFLGKVILIAGAAFVMAKVALLISVLFPSNKIHLREFTFQGSLKKGTGGSGGGTDHVIVTGGGGGGGGSHSHEHSSSWHRSMPYEHNKFEIIPADEHKYTEPGTYYEVAETDEFKRRTQYQQQQQNKLNKINF